MHRTVHDFFTGIKREYPHYFHRRTVLEVGSLNINGSLREFFDHCTYLGVDLGPGKDVDLAIGPIHMAQHHLCAHDMVVSANMLEHDVHWKDSLIAMRNLTCPGYQNKPGGMLIISCATPDFGEHGTHEHAPSESPYTNDYYEGRYPEDLHNWLEPHKYFSTWGSDQFGSDARFWGIRK